jgi:hypothetical protein
LDPVPPLSWLQEFEKNCYEYHDLPLFKVSPDKKLDEKLRFSLIQRPTPYSLGEYMSLFQRPGWNNWDNVMTELARWLTRHMDNRNVILWAVGGHGRIHPNWSTIIANHLKKIDDLIVRKAAGEVEAEKKMQRLLENAPSSILSPFMRSLWRAAIGGRVCTRNRIELFDTVTWLRETKLFGLTATLRFELKNMLCPKIEISKSVEWKDKIFEGNYDSAISPGKSLDWEIVVALKYPWRTLVDDIQQKEPWCSFLPMLLTEFTMLLRDALDLMQELGGAGYELGQAHIAQASIGEHPQNRRFNDWTVLIELTRDAWLATLKGNPHIA